MKAQLDLPMKVIQQDPETALAEIPIGYCLSCSRALGVVHLRQELDNIKIYCIFLFHAILFVLFGVFLNDIMSGYNDTPKKMLSCIACQAVKKLTD